MAKRSSKGNGSMDTAKLSDSIRKALDKIVTSALAQKSPEAIEAQKAYDALEADKKKVTAALGDDSPATKAAVAAIQKQQDKLDIEDKKGEINNRKHVATALIHAVSEWKIPVKMKAAALAQVRAVRAASVAESAPEEMDGAADAVYKALPPCNTKDDNCKAVDALASETKLEAKIVKSALGKLKREGKAEATGRGRGGGWRRK